MIEIQGMEKLEGWAAHQLIRLVSNQLSHPVDTDAD